MKNWGHDFLKAQGKEASRSDKHPGKSTKPRTSQTREKEHDREGDEHEESENPESDEDEDAHVDHAGDKRKPSAKKEKPSKKRETQKGHKGGESGEGESDYGSESGGYELAKGDTVSWKWGGGHPQGKVLDVKGEKYVSNKPAMTSPDANILLLLQGQASCRRMIIRLHARDSLTTLRLF
ncbi:HVA1 family protein [Candidatus Bathyarchaeota archaeon]|nr:HVA1 family protein [Candidatus Bathyarchaeota archaeon]